MVQDNTTAGTQPTADDDAADLAAYLEDTEFLELVAEVTGNLNTPARAA